LELHVEQGPVLEGAGVRLGLVSAIAAQRRYRCVVEGASGHAGTVPMDRRSDALCAASELMLALEAAAKTAGDCVVTVGRIAVEPNGTNVIPARVTFSIDARSPQEHRIDALERALDARCIEVRARRGVRVRSDVLEKRAATPMNSNLRAALRRAADRIGEPIIDVASGAGHDAMCVARAMPAAMLFVPSVGGASHSAAELTSDADEELGVRALCAAIVEVDNALRTN
ncbi:MAG: M20/M25/M40 family metallo-hydrolase, partial [Rhodanobacteraceae bacterium]